MRQTSQLYGDQLLHDAIVAAAVASDTPFGIGVRHGWRKTGAPRSVSVNLAASRLDPRCLVLEITESVLIHDTDAIIARLSELKQLGVRVAIDDFGTGYSSLSYIRQLPVDIVKVDKSFIDNIHQSAQASAVARAIIRLGHTLSLATVAEGIEEPAQPETLRKMQCELGQGYLSTPQHSP